MRKEHTVRIDAHFLARRLEVRRAKLWWLAEQLGVDRKTVSRWVTGKVKRLARENAEALARVLECGLDELTVPDESDVLATREEQRRAAEMVQRQDLMGLLSPTENWPLAESIIKATLQPDLPLRELGRLYNLLSIAAWRQGHHDEGRAHANRAREIGAQLADRGITARALFNLATLDSFASRHAAALAGYQACLEHPEGLEDRRAHGSALFNLGMVLRDFARFAEARTAITRAIEIFADAGLAYNLAIAWTGAGIVDTECGRFADATGALDHAAAHARAGNVLRYRDAVPLYQGDVLALSGDPARGRALVEPAFDALVRYPVHDLACHEIRARARRRAGDRPAASHAIAAGLAATQDWPTPRALLLEEAARLAQTLGDQAGEVRRRGEANALWSAMGLDARVRRQPVTEYGSRPRWRGPPAAAP